MNKIHKQKRLLYKPTGPLPAFTLPEVVVTLFLTGVLFITGFAIYIIINNQGKSFTASSSFYMEYIVTKKALANDFNKPGLATVSEDRSILELKPVSGMNGDNTPVRYQFDSSSILRQVGERVDTLLPGGRIVAFEKVNDSLPLVSFIKIESSYRSKPFFIYLEKNYSVEELLHFSNTFEFE